MFLSNFRKFTTEHQPVGAPEINQPTKNKQNGVNLQPKKMTRPVSEKHIINFLALFLNDGN